MTDTSQRPARPFKIAVIPGDGIGKEVMPEGLRVLDAACRRFGIPSTTSTSNGRAATTTPSTAR